MTRVGKAYVQERLSEAPSGFWFFVFMVAVCVAMTTVVLITRVPYEHRQVCDQTRIVNVVTPSTADKSSAILEVRDCIAWHFEKRNDERSPWIIYGGEP
jgi:hypothetical protein